MIVEKAVITTKNEMETFNLGKLLGSLIVNPAILTLNGDLGAGKTVLVRGAATGLGVKEPVRSPTFPLMMIYEGRLTLNHFDFYRLSKLSELDSLDLDEYFEGQTVVFIEWGLKFPRVLPEERLDINIDYDNKEENHRTITFYPNGVLYQELTNNLFETVRYDFAGKLKFK